MNVYHISYDHLLDEPTLEPRLPLTGGPDEDRKTARICVAPRIADCFRLFAWKDYHDHVNVYIADVNKGQLVSAKGKIADWAEGTREELWLLKPTKFSYLGMARMFRPNLVFGKPFWYWMWESRKHRDEFMLTHHHAHILEEGERKRQDAIAQMEKGITV